MLKVHPKFKIYGIGFADTIKDLFDEGVVADWQIPQLKIATFYDDDKEYFGALSTYTKAADDFIITVCDDELTPIGFIYL